MITIEHPLLRNGKFHILEVDYQHTYAEEIIVEEVRLLVWSDKRQSSVRSCDVSKLLTAAEMRSVVRDCFEYSRAIEKGDY